MKKTNAMRLVEAAGVDYEEFEYDASLGISGTDVAHTLNEDVKMVFKTLVTETNKGEHFVFIVPVAMELDLKKSGEGGWREESGYVETKGFTATNRLRAWRLLTHWHEDKA